MPNVADTFISEQSKQHIAVSRPMLVSLVLLSAMLHIAVLYYTKYYAPAQEAAPMIVNLLLEAANQEKPEPETQVPKEVNTQPPPVAESIAKALEKRKTEKANKAPKQDQQLSESEPRKPVEPSLAAKALASYINQASETKRTAMPCTVRQRASKLINCDSNQEPAPPIETSQYAGLFKGLLEETSVASAFDKDMREIAKLSLVQDALLDTMKRNSAKDKHLEQEYLQLSENINRRLKKYENVNLLKVAHAAIKLAREKASERKR